MNAYVRWPPSGYVLRGDPGARASVCRCLAVDGGRQTSVWLTQGGRLTSLKAALLTPVHLLAANILNSHLSVRSDAVLWKSRFLRTLPACLFVLLVSPVVALCAESLAIELPPETRTFRPGPAFEIANAQCLICHSEDYVAIQPPLPRAFWKSNVQKMQQKYGAPIPEEQVEPLVDYLAKAYGADTGLRSEGNALNQKAGSKNGPLSRAPDSASPGLEGAQLAVKFGCTSCHGVDKKIVGPPLKEIAAKYKGHADAFEKVSHQITQGGGGQWGPVPMPPFPQLSAAEIKALSQWVLNQQ